MNKKLAAFLLLGGIVAALIVFSMRRTNGSVSGGATKETRLSDSARSEAKAGQKAELTPIPSEQSFSQQVKIDPLTQGLESWKQKLNRPIEFYGKVVDEHEQPVGGAIVSFTLNQFTPPEGSLRTNTMSDNNGLFSLTGVTGSTLSIRLEKAGNYWVESNGDHFDYTEHAGAEAFHVELDRPIIFHLRKRGAGTDLITSQHGMSSDLEISGLNDGSIVRVDFFNQTVGTEGQLELSAVKPKRGQTATEWSFRICIPDGGLIEETDEFPFEAPESGYQPVVEYRFKQGETSWTKNLRKSFYITFGQPRRYGHITLQTGMYMGVVLRYAINPDGSRNLEPKQAVPAKRELPPGVTEVVPEFK